MKVKVIREDKMETKIISTNAKNIKSLLNDLEIDLENYVVIRNGRVVTDFSQEIKEGDAIKIIEAVGGG